MGGIRRLIEAAAAWRHELIIFTLVAASAAAGAFAGLQQAINDFSFRLLPRPASGDIVIVQIDPKSLQAIDTWPWPRSRHAELVERLAKADVDIIALDIDFSSPSRAAEDERLAEALASAKGRVVLPSFVQHAAPGVSDELTETNPLPALRDSALIGNANIFAPSGETRQASIGIYLPDGRYRPTFAGLVGQNGRAIIDRFDIDFGIDTSTIKRLSYVDILRGNFDPAAVKGKRVLVGATAIELGDFVPVPMRGVVPGVELQALIAESVVQGRMLQSFGLAGALALVVLVLAIVRPGRSVWADRGYAVRLGACAGALGAGQLALYAAMPVMAPSAPAFGALALCFVAVAGAEFGQRAKTVLRERSASNARRAMVNLIVEGSSDGIVVADARGRIELANERAAQLLNATRTTLTGRQVSNHLPAFEAAQGANDVERHAELTVECDGGPTTLEMSVRRLALPAAAGVAMRIDVYTLRDVTAKRKLEEAERRVQEERLMAERAKSNFIANMSHELRTPLNAVIGFSEMMTAQAFGPLGSPKYVEFCDVVAKSGHHLLALINNVLEISRIDHDGTSVETDAIDFAELAAPCVQFARSTRDYKGQTIVSHVSPDTGLFSDRRLIKLILLNLLSNAVKFTGERGTIGITAQASGHDFVFEVSDDGTGIDAAVMPHLTKLFYQSDHSFTRKHEGMGVGLYLVKRYVDRLKGRLEFESEPGRGTTVRVTLPGASAAPAKAAAA